MSEWISVKDRLPEIDFMTGFSKNFLAVERLGSEYRLSIFNRYIVELTEEGFNWSYGKIDEHYGDLREAECLDEDEYLITHWMPLPKNPKE